MRALLLCLCACLSLVSCKKEEPVEIFIRVRNASQYPLENIIVKSRSYGALGVGQSSDYQLLQVDDSIPGIILTVQGEQTGLVPLNDMPVTVPTKALKPGRYTYVLAVTKGNNGTYLLAISREEP
jgi:hypothetical protein